MVASAHTLMSKLCSCCSDKMVPRRQGAWTKDEDEQLMAYTKVHGVGRWHLVPQNSGLLRCGKSCRARWLNYLRPDIIGGDFTDREKELISELNGFFGNNWTKIAKRLPGRTNVEVRNYWKRTHKPKKSAANDHDEAQTSLGTVSENEELTAGFSFSNQLTTPNEGKFADLNLDLALSFPCQRQTPSASCSSVLPNEEGSC